LNLVTDARIGSTDANLPLSLGVQAVAIGAGGRGWGIHTLAEGYDPAGRDVALRRALLLVLDLCGIVGKMDVGA
jgi:tripeptide aminopeptidase